eukprot:TRINITY_DN7940_c0_g1_i1.p1 TRINITY_DN7940_c0_g1~~TRINITY_DN7940_c0_g1_i1.p1  ORF type:complete len:920 (-),score=199.96 TRINITY_DN7940_c0_g1_i1:226-2772(-)
MSPSASMMGSGGTLRGKLRETLNLPKSGLGTIKISGGSSQPFLVQPPSPGSQGSSVPGQMNESPVSSRKTKVPNSSRRATNIHWAEWKDQIPYQAHLCDVLCKLLADAGAAESTLSLVTQEVRQFAGSMSKRTQQEQIAKDSMNWVVASTQAFFKNQQHIEAVVKCQSIARRFLVIQRLKNIPRDTVLNYNEILIKLFNDEREYASRLNYLISNFITPLKKRANVKQRRRASIAFPKLKGFAPTTRPNPTQMKGDGTTGLLSTSFEHFDESMSEEDDRVLTNEEIKDLFNNIEAITALENGFLDKCEKALQQWPLVQVGSLFMNMMPFLKIYVEYGSKYHTSIEFLKKLNASHKEFQLFVHQVQETNPHMTVSLEELLTLPIHRIFEYYDTLEKLSKTYWGSDGSQESQSLLLATSALKEVTQNMSSNLRQAQNTSKMEIIEKALGEQTLSVRGRIFHGDVVCQKVSSKKKIHLYLFSDIILVSELKKAASSASSSSLPSLSSMTSIWSLSNSLSPLSSSSFTTYPEPNSEKMMFTAELVKSGCQIIEIGKSFSLTTTTEPSHKIKLQTKNSEDFTIWNSIFTEAQKQHLKTKVYGMPLETILSKDQKRIPVLVETIVTLLTRSGIQLEGIFRISVAAKVIESLKYKIDSGEEKWADNLDGYELSSLLKQFLRELPEPLFSATFFDIFFKQNQYASFEHLFCTNTPKHTLQRPIVASSSNETSNVASTTQAQTAPGPPPVRERTYWESPEVVEKMKQLIQLITTSLNSPNFELVKYLVGFLKQVSDESQVNKMTSFNLSTIFAPNVIRPPVSSLECISSDTAFSKPITFFQFLIDHHEQLSGLWRNSS